MALCSESTGTIWSGRGRRLDERPADDERLLVRQRERPTRPPAPRGLGRRPIDPVIPLSTTSAPHPAATVAASSPTTTSGRWSGARRGGRGGHGGADVLDRAGATATSGHLVLDGLAGDELDVRRRPTARRRGSGSGARRRPRGPGCRSSRCCRGRRRCGWSPLHYPPSARAADTVGGHVVKTRSSMSCSSTTLASGWKRPCSKSFWTSSSTWPEAVAVLLDGDDGPAAEALDAAEVVDEVLARDDVLLARQDEDEVGLVGEGRGAPQVAGAHPVAGAEALALGGGDRHDRAPELQATCP